MPWVGKDSRVQKIPDLAEHHGGYGVAVVLALGEDRSGHVESGLSVGHEKRGDRRVMRYLRISYTIEWTYRLVMWRIIMDHWYFKPMNHSDSQIWEDIFRLHGSHLFSHIEGGGSIGVLPTAPESLSENRIVRFLQPLGLLVETRQIESNDFDHAHVRVILEWSPARIWEQEDQGCDEVT